MRQWRDGASHVTLTAMFTPPAPDLGNVDGPALRTMLLDLLAERGEYEQARTELEQLQVRQAQAQAIHLDEIRYKDAKIAQLTHEIAGLRRYQFGKKGGQLSGVQGSFSDETVSADIAAIEAELELLSGKPIPKSAHQPKSTALPEHLPRVEYRHEPDSTTCPCGCQLLRIGEDVSEKLDYTLGLFSVERHIRGKWVCKQCATLTQAPVPPHVIEKGMASTGLLAHVRVAKYADHLPLYRQEKIFERAGMRLSRSTLRDGLSDWPNW